MTMFARRAALLAGFLFLYAPIALLVVYSFNASRLVTVWGGFSTRWYGALLANEQMLASAATSLKVAALSAALSTVLALMAAVALERFGRFGGRTLFVGALFAPIVMPEIVLGLSLLLVFVALDLPRGFWTVVAAHTTFSLGFATVAIRARLATLDRSLEEAAQDLGATPLAAFAHVAVPQLLPAIAGAYAMAFILSLDDLVIASFTSGPGSTTLPMRIYSQVRLGVSPEINAASTLLLAFGSLALGALAFVSWRRGEK